jgi:catechol 2,3-dioxygenase-like lactoylglutathione lyase family enzyme
MGARQELVSGSAVRQWIGVVTLVVCDYDEAIAYFTQKLGFALVRDTPVTHLYGNPWDLIESSPDGAPI